jgi:hypothetical protein
MVRIMVMVLAFGFQVIILCQMICCCGLLRIFSHPATIKDGVFVVFTFYRQGEGASSHNKVRELAQVQMVYQWKACHLIPAGSDSGMLSTLLCYCLGQNPQLGGREEGPLKETGRIYIGPRF